MSKKVYILLIVAFGFFLIPNATFACNTHTYKKELSSNVAKDCCTKGNNAKTVKHNCCNKENSSKEKSKGECTGKCGHNHCTISVVHYALNTSFTSEIALENDFSFSNKVNFNYLKTDISSGFYSLWVIPKIG